ncbi:MAG: alpha/beta hydrolase [bacterium]
MMIFSTKRPIISLCGISMILASLMNISANTAQQEFPLWPNGAPGALGTTTNDIPTLTPYLPEPSRATGAAIIVCPGGGYGGLAAHEGAGYATWLSDHGVAAFVLKYRLGSHGYRHPVMLQDAARALRLVRTDAIKMGVDPEKIGIMGSSAGGHLASTLLTHFDAGKPDDPDPVERVSSRPDLGVLCYPVITMGSETHFGSRSNLLGKTPTTEQIELLSNEKQVTDKTPNCFLWHTWEDPAVKVENTLMFAAALRQHGVPFDLHIYQHGGHGLGLGKSASDPSKLHPWSDDLMYWLHSMGYVR